MLSNDLKIAVLRGGISAEREVSLVSGANIAGAIAAAGLDVIQSDITPDDLSILDDGSIDVFFLGLHGTFGEDGQVQKIMEDRGLVFTGSGSVASKAAFDKHKSQQVFCDAGVTVPWHVCITDDAKSESLVDTLAKVGEKFVVKPITQGSSVGVEIITGPEKAASAAIKCFGEHGDCMVEQFIDGREITVGIVNGKTLPIIEIRTKTQFYDYHAKYVDDATDYLFDTVTDKKLIEKINDIALTCFNALGCRHLSRVDLILADDGTPYVLEINTLPGFTSHSLLPMAARKAGIETGELCKQIIQAALHDGDSEPSV
jgi:D-alanine-D-alanine ligase